MVNRNFPLFIRFPYSFYIAIFLYILSMKSINLTSPIPIRNPEIIQNNLCFLSNRTISDSNSEWFSV